MKPILYILLFISVSAFGQNYRPLQPNDIRYFINGEGYLKGMRIDSVTTVGNNTVYHPFRTPRGYYTFQTLDNNGGSWLGKKIVEMQDGTFLFDNLWGDTIIIKTQANLNSSWIMYSDTSSIYYLATVIQKDTMSVLNTLDSIKKIEITAYHINGQIQTTDPLNNAQIILSKNHGFVSVMDLYLIPFHPPGMPTYWGEFDYFFDEYIYWGSVNPGLTAPKYTFNLTEFYSPNTKDIYNCEVSDVFITSHFNWPVSGFWKDSFISKTTYIDHYEYTYERFKLMYGVQSYPLYDTYIASQNVTFYKIIDTTKMPEEYASQFFYYYMPWDSTFCHKSKAYKMKDITIDLNGNINQWAYPGDYVIKEGCGKVRDYFMDNSVPQDYTTNKLVYTRKNGITCGSYPSSLSIENRKLTEDKIDIYPNPASDILTIENNSGHSLEYTLLNIYGQTMQTSNSDNQNHSIDVKKIPSGIYYLILKTRDNEIIKKKIQVVH